MITNGLSSFNVTEHMSLLLEGQAVLCLDGHQWSHGHGGMFGSGWVYMTPWLWACSRNTLAGRIDQGLLVLSMYYPVCTCTVFRTILVFVGLGLPKNCWIAGETPTNPGTCSKMHGERYHLLYLLPALDGCGSLFANDIYRPISPSNFGQSSAWLGNLHGKTFPKSTEIKRCQKGLKQVTDVQCGALLHS